MHKIKEKMKAKMHKMKEAMKPDNMLKSLAKKSFGCSIKENVRVIVFMCIVFMCIVCRTGTCVYGRRLFSCVLFVVQLVLLVRRACCVISILLTHVTRAEQPVVTSDGVGRTA